MCIISGPVVSVASTKILVLPSKNRKRQLTVYKNEVATQNQNAMCLPVPNPHTVTFETVSKDIFKQCANSFSIARSSMIYEHAGAVSASFSIKKSYLPVVSHGSYDVVLVPSMNDIERIPPTFTTLSEEVIKFLKASYPETFGVVLCRLRQGKADYEPFAYSHDIQPNSQLFFPTKHFHNHNVTEEQRWDSIFENSLLGGRYSSRTLPQINNSLFADDWDHEIYSAETPAWCHESKRKGMKKTNEINWLEIPNDFQLGSSTSLRCKEIVGMSTNIDIEMPIEVV